MIKNKVCFLSFLTPLSLGIFSFLFWVFGSGSAFAAESVNTAKQTSARSPDIFSIISNMPRAGIVFLVFMAVVIFIEFLVFSNKKAEPLEKPEEIIIPGSETKHQSVVPPPPKPRRSFSIKISRKVAILLFIVLFALATIPAVIFLAGQNQDIRQKAATGTVDCCRVLAANKCTSAFNSYDMEVARFGTIEECNAYVADPKSFSYTCNCGASCESNQGRNENQVCEGYQPPLDRKQNCSTSGSENFKVEIINQALCTMQPTVTPTGVPTATPTPTTPADLPASCDSMTVLPNPVIIGQNATFTCNVTNGSGANTISGYAFNVDGIRYPSAGDTWQSVNTLTIPVMKGGDAWCGAKTQGGPIVGGKVASCMINLGEPSGTPTPTPTSPAPQDFQCGDVLVDKKILSIGETVTMTGFGWVSDATDRIDLIKFTVTKGGVEKKVLTVSATRDGLRDTSGKYFYTASTTFTATEAGNDYGVAISVHSVKLGWRPRP